MLIVSDNEKIVQITKEKLILFLSAVNLTSLSNTKVIIITPTKSSISNPYRPIVILPPKPDNYNFYRTNQLSPFTSSTYADFGLKSSRSIADGKTGVNCVR